MLVKDLMIPKEGIVTIRPMAKIREALQTMKNRHVKSLVVEKAHKHDAYGFITFKNILYSIVANDGDIDLLRVYDIYTKPAIQLSANLDIKYASKMMMNNSIKRILIVDNNELQGIITMSDILTALMNTLDSD